MRSYLEIGLAVAALLGSGLWLHARDARMRAEGRAELMRAARDSAVAVADSVAREADEAAERADSVRLWADSVRTRAERDVERVRERRPEIVERIVTAPDTGAIRDAVEELEASHEEEVASLRDIIAGQDSLVAELTGQVAMEQEARRQVQAALDAALAVSRERSAPGFVERWGERLLWAAGGVAVGYGLNSGG